MNTPFDPHLLEKETDLVNADTRVFLEFYSPSALRAYRAPDGSVLIGNNHIVRGATFVIGGAPGVGKSRASVALAVAGATGQSWFGLTVHRKFKTLILQNENGRLRLSEEFASMAALNLDEWVIVSAPPPFGLAIRDASFRKTLSREIERFKPDVVLIDPWNAVSGDDKARDYLETFELIRSVIPAGDDGPALGIIAHTRKPKSDERASGRGLINLLAGSYVLASVPRSVFVLQPASDQPEDNRVVFTCCKNNDGEMGAPSAWTRQNGLFAPVAGFAWEEFHAAAPARRTITSEHVSKALKHGKGPVLLSEAKQQLMEMTGAGQSAAYEALNLDGRYGVFLRSAGTGRLQWIGPGIE